MPVSIETLRKLAQLMDGRRDYLSCQIASEGGKPLADAIVETERAIERRVDQLVTHPRPLP
jgi:acyl-CoA reductase-like NAD-dependent aldehyde dehydrogenase